MPLVRSAGLHASTVRELLVPNEFETCTLYVPDVFAGMVNVSVVAEVAVIVAAVPPTVHELAPARFVPVIVIESPPAVSAREKFND